MGGRGEHRSLLNFHFSFPNLLHHHHYSDGSGSGSGSKKHGEGRTMKDVPKGCLAIKVGGEDEEQQRFVIPLIYFNHPSFVKLLKEAEEKYGFDHDGTIAIPCNVEEFRRVQRLIGKEHNHHHIKGSVHPHRTLLVACFRA